MTWVSAYGFKEQTNDPGVVGGFAKAIQYGTTADVVRAMNVGKTQNFTQRLIEQRANPFARPADETDEIFNVAASVARDLKLTPMQFNELRRDARFLANGKYASFNQDVRDQGAYIAKRDETLAGVGVGASLLAGVLDPVDLSVAVATGGTVGALSKGARLAGSASFIARRPFAAGLTAEAGVEAGMQPIRGTLSGNNEIDVTSIVAAGLFGGVGSSMIAASTSKQLRTVQAVAALNPTERKLVRLVNSASAGDAAAPSPSGGTQPVRVFGQDTFLGNVYEWLSPRRSAQMSTLGEVRDTARLLGGILQESGDGNVRAGAPEFEAEVRLFDAEDAQGFAILQQRMMDALEDTPVTQDDMLVAVERYRRFRNAGKEITADDLRMSPEVFAKLKPEIEGIASDLDRFFDKKRKQMVESNIYQSDILTELSGASYNKRAFSYRNIKMLDDLLERKKMHKLITASIVAKQGLPKEYIARKAALGEVQLEGIRIDDFGDGATIEFKTAFILREFDEAVTKKARKYMDRLGKAYYDNVVDRLRGARDGRIDYFTSDDLEEEIVAALMREFKSDATDTEAAEMAELVTSILVRKKRPDSKRPDADFLNSKLGLDDTHSMSLKELGFSDADVARLSVALDDTLGSQRISKGDRISFEDLLVSDALNLANSTRWGANRLSVLGKRGILNEDDTVASKVRRMRKAFDDYKEKAKKRGTSQKTIEREKHRVNRGIFDLMTAAGRNPNRAYDEMIDVDPVTRSQVASFDSAFGQITNGARNLTTAVFLPQVLFAQIPEFVQAASTVGLGNVRFWNENFNIISDLRRGAKTGKFDTQTAEDMVYVAGIDPTNSMFRFDRPDLNMRAEGKTRAARFYNMTGRLRDISMNLNLLKPITIQMRALTYRRSVANLFKSANGQSNPFDEYDLSVILNLPEGAQRDLAFDLIKRFAEVDADTGAVRSLRTDLWHDVSDEASLLADDLELRLNEFAHRLVQEASMGMSPAMLQGGLMKYFTQFMTYSLNAFEKQAVPLNARVRSGNAQKARMILYGGLGASMMMYLSKLYLSTLGMSETKRRERFEKGLTPSRVAQMSISYIPAMAAPMTFVAPMLQILSNAGQDTQLSRGAIPTAPTLQAVTGLLDSMQGVKRLMTGDPTEYSTTQLMRYITMGASQLPYVVPFTNSASAVVAGEAPSFGPNAMTPAEEQ
jgi:hypothetical protein